MLSGGVRTMLRKNTLTNIRSLALFRSSLSALAAPAVRQGVLMHDADRAMFLGGGGVDGNGAEARG